MGLGFAEAPVTTSLAMAIVGVFVAMVLQGVGLFSPSIDGLIAWGANFGPRTLDGEVWRLLSSVFLHIGLIHLAFNLYVLTITGPFVERLYGSPRYLALYLASGTLGSLASVAWHGLRVSAGASGAIFGIYGALLAFLVRQRSRVPMAALRELRQGTLAFLGFNLVFGLVIDGIDMAAHVGGLAAGFGIGLVLCPTSREARRGWLAAVATVALTAALVPLAIGWVPNGVVGFERALEDFGAVETQVIDTINGAVEQRQREEISNTDLARVLETEVLPPWREARERFDGTDMTGLPRDLEERRRQLSEYMRLRQEGWELQSAAVRENDLAKGAAALERQEQADEILKSLGQ